MTDKKGDYLSVAAFFIPETLRPVARGKDLMHCVLQMNTLSNPTISGDIAEQVTIQLYSACNGDSAQLNDFIIMADGYTSGAKHDRR